MKPKIKGTEDGGWEVTRPAYGFGKPEVETYPTWKEAMASLKVPLGSAGPIVERAGRSTVAYGHWRGQSLPSRVPIMGGGA